MARSWHSSYRRRAALLVGLVLAGTAGVPTARANDGPFGSVDQAPARSLTQILDHDAHARGEYQILLGELALNRGDTVRAAKAYTAALDASSDAGLAKRAARIALAANRHDLAYRAARVWASNRPDDRSAQRIAVRLAFLNGDSDGLAHFAKVLVAGADSQRDGYSTLAHILSGKPGQADTAIAAVKKLADAHTDEAGPQYALGRLALSYNRLDLAAKAAHRAVADDQHWADAALLASAIDVRQGHFGAARKRIAGLSGQPHDRARYHVALARMLLHAGKDDDGLAEFKQAVSIDPGSDGARYGLGLVALSAGDLKIANQQFRKLRGDHEHSNDAAFYLGVIDERQDQPAKAKQWYSRVAGGDHALQAKVRVAQLTDRQGDLAGARRQLQKLADQHPDQASRLHAVEGSLLVKAGQLKKAVAVYDKALANASDNSDLLYARSLAYERLGRIGKAEADLKKILANDADNVQALNALGYMLTNHSTHYARAERYIRKSLAQDPDNPAVRDSLGWVEYKQGHLAAARKQLEKAYQGSQNPEIAAHLGEVRWKQGDHDAARRIWHKAAAQHPDNGVLKSTMKRLSS